MSIITDILHKAGLATTKELQQIQTLSIERQATALRSALAVTTRAYAAAQSGRLNANWTTVTGNPLSDIRSGIKLVRDRARDLQANDPTGAHIIRTWQNNVPGPKGFSFKSKATLADNRTSDEAGNKAVEAAWYDWSKPQHCSVHGKMSRRMIEHFVTAQIGRDGEFLIRKVYNKSKYGFQLQPLEVELLDESYNDRSGNNLVVMGVEVDTWGKPQAYWIRVPNQNARMYGYYLSSSRERIPADQIYHGFDFQYACQTRGISWLAPIMLRMKALTDWEQYQWAAAQVNSAYAMIFKDQNGTTTRPFDGKKPDPDTGKIEMEFSEAMIKDIGNKDVVIDRAEFPNQMYGEYLRLMEQRVGTGVEMDYPHISGDLSQTNFSSARFGAANTQEAFRGIQLLLIEQFCEPVATDWMLMAFAKNQIILESGLSLPAERFEKFVNAVTFTGRTWGFIQPLQDIMAAVVALEYGLQSPIEWFEERGKDMYEVYNDIKTAKALRDKLQIPTKLDELDQAMSDIGNAPTPATKAEKIKIGVRTLAEVLMEIDAAESTNNNDALDAAQEKLMRQVREILKKAKNGHYQPS